MQSSLPRRPRDTDWKLNFAASAALLLFWLAIPLVGYRRLSRLFPARSEPPPRAFSRRVAAAIESNARRRVPRATCLVQACAARALFALRGYRVTMRVGVRPAGAGIAAHAWLMSGEDVILGSLIEDFGDYRPIADFG